MKRGKGGLQKSTKQMQSTRNGNGGLGLRKNSRWHHLSNADIMDEDIKLRQAQPAKTSRQKRDNNFE